MSKTVIAIEDDPQIAELIRLLLASDDVVVMHYGDGPRGLAGVLELKPDLVLLDIMVPGINGWEVYDHIRASDAVKEVPIIILSVTPQTFERRINFTQSTIDFYMSKPFDILSLRALIDELLEVTNWHVGNEMPVPRMTKPPLKPITSRLITQTQRMRRIELKKTPTGEFTAKPITPEALDKTSENAPDKVKPPSPDETTSDSA